MGYIFLIEVATKKLPGSEEKTNTNTTGQSSVD
jgi:hypothetical protein